MSLKMVRATRVTLLDLKKNLRKGMNLYCTICTNTYSANASDYWNLNDGHIFKCCNQNMILGNKYNIFVPIGFKIKLVKI